MSASSERPRTRPVRLAIVVTALAATTALRLGSPASAAAATAISGQGWAWLAQREGLPSLAGASGIDPGQLPVSWAEQVEKLAFLRLAPLEPEEQLTLTLALAESAANRNVYDADILACVITEAWQEAGPMAWEKQPSYDCGAGVRGVYQAETQDFFLDLNPLLPALRDVGMHGIALVPDPTGEASVFQVVFRSAIAGGARVQHSAPPGGAIDADDGPAPQERAATVPDEPAPDQSVVPQAPAARAGPGTGVAELGTPTEESEAAQPANERRPSFAGVYGGMLGLAILVALRAVFPAFSGIVMRRPGDDGPRRARAASWRVPT